jgi:Flp pilus assembly protein TadG
MRLKPKRTMTRRSRQRGVAALEFALAMTLFLPLLFAVLNYGYYFYVSITAVEAARVGARQLWNQTVTACSNNANVTAARTVVTGTGVGTAKAYMGQIGMSGPTYTTVTATCTTVVPSSAPAGLSDPVWQFQVKVEFPLPVPTFGWAIPRSPVTPTHGLFTQTLTLQGR